MNNQLDGSKQPEEASSSDVPALDEPTSRPTEDYVIALKALAATGVYDPSTLIEGVHALGLDRTADGRVWLAELERAVVLQKPIEAATASGIARAQLIRLLSTDHATRRLFAELGHHSGAVHRITLRHEKLPSQMRRDRELGLVPGWEERLAAAVAPWAVRPSAGPAVDFEREIAGFLADRHLPWPWLARATVGAFTWYVDSVVSQLLRAMGETWAKKRPSDPTPTPADLPALDEWYCNDGDGPRLPADRAFGPIRLYRNDSIELARSRVRSWVREIETYFADVAQAAAPVGAIVDKRRPTVIRNVTWFYRNEVEGASIVALTRAEFAAGETDAGRRRSIVDARRKDVHDGIAAARALLADHPYPPPILPLAEYEAGRVGI
ncbi:MAG: hypothetical protein ABSC46_13945 [Candidatus Limnocylindrales bacterium]